MIIASYGIRFYRPINDLDMNMESEEWMKLQKLVDLGIGVIETYNGQRRYFLDMTKDYQEIDPAEKDFSIEIFTPFNLSIADLYNLKSPTAISRI